MSSRFHLLILISGSVDYLEDLFHDNLVRPTARNHAMPVRMQILIALRYYATGHFYEVIGDSFGVHKSTVSRTVDRVTQLLVGLKDQVIRFPTSREDQEEIKSGFHRIAEFPNVLGCIDGTHVRLDKKPSQEEYAYVCRKGYHSINVQVVTDHKGRLLNVCARWPGSTHDNFILGTSQLGRTIAENQDILNGGKLLGDQGYGQKPWLLVAFPNPATPGQRQYNRAHKKTRCSVERAIGSLKKRWHVLHWGTKLDAKKTCKIILACCVLQNLAINLREPEPEDDEEIILEEEEGILQDQAGPQEARRIRDAYVRQFFD